MLTEAANVVQRLAALRQQRIEVDADDLELKADPTILRRIVDNFLDNALNTRRLAPRFVSRRAATQTRSCCPSPTTGRRSPSSCASASQITGTRDPLSGR
jgi:hypothetical protein